jgi:hypothetical protein
MRKYKRKHPECERNCYNCNKCTYLGEGGYMCEDSQDIVIELWEPTKKFNSCKGRRFESI